MDQEKRVSHVVIKPKLHGVQRRLEVLQGLLDAQREFRFERCQEVKAGGSVQKYLLKRVRLEGSDPKVWGQDLNMCSQLRQARHILNYGDAWVTHNVQHILYEDALMFLSVCLMQMLPNRPCSRLYPLWLFHLISALEYMHEKFNQDHPILHRSVHPDNIMVTEGCLLKLCDFGISKRLSPGDSGVTKTVVGGGLGLFQSPEIAANMPYNQLADIWSFGVTAAYMLDYARARKTASAHGLKEIVKESDHKKETKWLVTAALNKDPGERPKASDIVKLLEEHFGYSFLHSSPPESIFPEPLLISEETSPAISALKTITHITGPVQSQAKQFPRESTAAQKAHLPDDDGAPSSAPQSKGKWRHQQNRDGKSHLGHDQEPLRLHRGRENSGKSAGKTSLHVCWQESPGLSDQCQTAPQNVQTGDMATQTSFSSGSRKSTTTETQTPQRHIIVQVAVVRTKDPKNNSSMTYFSEESTGRLNYRRSILPRELSRRPRAISGQGSLSSGNSATSSSATRSSSSTSATAESSMSTRPPDRGDSQLVLTEDDDSGRDSSEQPQVWNGAMVHRLDSSERPSSSRQRMEVNALSNFPPEVMYTLGLLLNRNRTSERERERDDVREETILRHQHRNDKDETRGCYKN